ncbi:ethanolamine kinase 2 isoform X1 [Sphaerodactylus townsendi]|uniref:ethanolamine kinase 2 isoform X1 n=1 Tax=Sphaerodactylus townsendi TaxID=933632 RepID=UPI002026831C|nr:ethanolamine kinase 2 isoform X1 [Sphaerodactylus townsendi]
MGAFASLPLLRGWSCLLRQFCRAFLSLNSVRHLERADLYADRPWGMEEEEEEQRVCTSYPAIPSISIAVDETNVLPGALRLIRKLRPQWETARVKTKLFTDGITNKLMACYTDENMRDAVLVRVYGRKTELIVDRASELRNFQVLQDHGCAPSLYCTFENGYCYEFVQGKALGPEHVHQPQIFRLVAQEMAQMHRIHSNGRLPKPCLWHRLYKYFNIVKTEFSKKTLNSSIHREVPMPSLKVLEEEICWMKAHLSQLGSPIVFCHNDLLSKNIIYNEEEGHVHFIDYEYTGYNYQAYDIGNHFNEFAGLNEVDYSLYPCKEMQLQWLRHYLKAYKKMNQVEPGGRGKNRGGNGAVSEEELETLYVQVNQFALASHFLWACWGLIQAQFSTIDFNFARYADIRFKQYFKTKPVVTALKMPK